MPINSICRTLILILFFLLSACSKQQDNQTIRLAINPWPGYEFLYLADQKGLFKQNGLDIELIELASLADVQRVFIQGRADAMASTVIEAVQAAGTTQKEMKIVLIPDYSNGGDVIVSHRNYPSIDSLKGKRIGAEIGSLGMFILSRALEKNRLTLNDVDVLNVEQLKAEKALLADEIDAVVTYPPFSTEILKHPQYKTIFTSADIPGDIIDTITVSTSSIIHDDQWIEKFHNAWQQALDYAAKNKAEAYGIMSAREGISPAEFEEALSGLKLLKKESQQKALSSTKLKNNIQLVCNDLAAAQALTFSCSNINQLLSGINPK